MRFVKCRKIELYPGLYLLHRTNNPTRQLTEKVLSDNNIFAINFSIPNGFKGGFDNYL